MWRALEALLATVLFAAAVLTWVAGIAYLGGVPIRWWLPLLYASGVVLAGGGLACVRAADRAEKQEEEEGLER